MHSVHVRRLIEVMIRIGCILIYYNIGLSGCSLSVVGNKFNNKEEFIDFYCYGVGEYLIHEIVV